MQPPPNTEVSLTPHKRSQPMVRRFRALLLVFLAFLVGYAVCTFKYFINPPDRRIWSHGNSEEARVTSPDGTMDAVVSCQCDTPAMVSPYVFLHIVPKGQVGEYSTPAVLESRRGLKLEWIDNAHLKVDPSQGTIEYFTNLWAPKDDKLSFVEIILTQDPAHGLLTPEGHFN